MASDAEVEAAAEAISRAFREEAFDHEHDPPEQWNEFLNAARAALEAAERVRAETTKGDG